MSVAASASRSFSVSNEFARSNASFQTSTAAEFDALFKRTFQGYKNVPYQSAQASAAVLVWKDAFERANSFDTEKLRDALAATDMDTFYGKIKFSEAGNNIAKPMVLRQIQNGQFNVVAPPKWASHKVEYPRTVQ